MKILRVFLTICGVLLLLTQVTCGRSLRNPDLVPLHWNFTSQLEFSMSGEFRTNDRFKLWLFDGLRTIPLSNRVVSLTPTNAVLKAIVPRRAPALNRDVYVMTAKVAGHLAACADFRVERDTTPPVLEVIGVSPSIQRGGSALVVFSAKDDAAMGKAWVADDQGMRFYAEPFVRPGYYAVLFGWYVENPSFEAWIVARDEAGNTVSNKLEITKKPYAIQRVRLNFQPGYVAEKVTELGITNDLSGASTSNQIAAINRAMARTVTVSIWDVTSRPPEGLLTNIGFRNFNPAPNAVYTSTYALLRQYYFNGQLMKQSYHLGLDLAKARMNFDIHDSVPATVAYAGYHGGYGNMMILNHGLGLYTLYGHCSNMIVRTGDRVTNNQIIGLSGKTGVATGVHLHFSVLLQGEYVNPTEWMSLAWIKENVNKVAERAASYILLQPDDVTDTNAVPAAGDRGSRRGRRGSR